MPEILWHIGSDWVTKAGTRATCTVPLFRFVSLHAYEHWYTDDHEERDTARGLSNLPCCVRGA